MGRDETLGFFALYRAAFDRLDGDAVADLWHVGSGIADSRNGHGRLTWWADDATLRANQRALCAQYSASGYHHADFELVDHLAMGADHAFARLRWTLWRGDGDVLQRFHAGYQLMRGADGPKVLLVTAYQEDLTAMAGKREPR